MGDDLGTVSYMTCVGNHERQYDYSHYIGQSLVYILLLFEPFYFVVPSIHSLEQDLIQANLPENRLHKLWPFWAWSSLSISD